MRMFFSFLLVISMTGASAQNIGIGTTSPNSKAMLDISSTSRGVLFPRMSAEQRASIFSPPEGLMVYDTDVSQLYQYDGSIWRKILNSTYWSQSTTRNRIYNLADSIGIGTSAPTERLDVTGNIRARDNVYANSMYAETGIGTGTLTASSNVLINGTTLLNGAVTANSLFTINDPAATLNLRSSSEDKGFVQLSGNNLRIGVYSGNNDGKIILRSGGTDRMTIFDNGNIVIGSTAANTAKLRVAGDLSVQDNVTVQDNVHVGGRLTRNQTGNADALPFCFGKVAEDGSIVSGSGNFSVVKINISSGNYEITCPGITGNVICVATSRYNTDVVSAYHLSGTTVKVYCRNSSTGDLNDSMFSFIMYSGN